MSLLIATLCLVGLVLTSLYLRLAGLITFAVLVLFMSTSGFFGFISPFNFFILACVLITAGVFLLYPPIRRNYLSKPAFNLFKRSLPKMSETEQIALDAGTTWWDAQLFSGLPKWDVLLSSPKPALTAEEQAFLDGPVETLCKMLNDWEITQEKDMPPEVWDYLKSNGFFALEIEKKYGGKGFSSLAHSEVLAKIAAQSGVAASTVSVPNSLGPAELLHRYGTKEQQDHYLPRLASGQEVPCFALTGTYAGSDATSIPDTGIVCYDTFNGEKVLGMRLTWEKRYITLAPIATVLGLAFKLHDPEQLLKKGKTDLGITCALIPTNTPGVEIGDRHLPLSAPFQNGPTRGQDVFVPIDYIIGGPDMAGQGWRMLVECLSCGRAISLPSNAAGAIRICATATGAYARIRKQFNTHIGRFEGIEEKLAQLAGMAYRAEAARKITASVIDQGESPSVIGAILKYQLTEQGRMAIIHAMDIHGGKAIITGPKNYLANAYMNAPIGITVEGANILTRCMIVFGQGVFRCHPYVMQEISAIRDASSENEALREFDKAIFAHIKYTCSNAVRSFVSAITFGKLIKKPVTSPAGQYYQQVTWASSAFAFMADMALFIYQGKLKFKESISGRFSDMLSMLYLSSCALKQFEDQGQPEEDLPLLAWVIEDCLSQFWQNAGNIIRNVPNLAMEWLLRTMIVPFGRSIKRPADSLNSKVAKLLLEPNATRDRLMGNAYLSASANNAIGQLEQTLKQVIAADPIEARIQQAIKDEVIKSTTRETQLQEALETTLITEAEAMLVEQAEKAAHAIIEVDSFAVNKIVMQNAANESKENSSTM